MYEVMVGCLVLTAVLAYCNHRFIGLPPTIGVMGISMALSLVLIATDKLGFSALRDYEASLLTEIDFSTLLMEGMLSLLLFAGALHVDLSQLRSFKWQVAFLAVFGTLTSTLIVAICLYLLLPLFGLALPLIYCLVFGALISPTDPIAVMGILKSAGAPPDLEIIIAGESLFNDGVGVVVFSVLLMVAVTGEVPGTAEVAHLLALEAGGGIVFGLALGTVVYAMLKSIDSYQEEVLITLAAVLGGYTLANHLHISGPLAMVVAGLLIGNHGRTLAMSDRTRVNLHLFWDLVDSILNAVLFVLIGLEVILLKLSPTLALAGCAVILIVLGARVLTVGAPIAVLRFKTLPKGALPILTWGGLRGGISVALAVSLPAGAERDMVLALTYIVVVFSILVQGLTIGRVVRRTVDPAPEAESG